MRLGSLVFGFAIFCGSGLAAPVTLTFEGLADVESVTSQYSGLTFSNTIALIAGFTLNEAEFPPYSGITVVSDDGGPVEIDFGATLAFHFSGRLTYLQPVVVQAYRGSTLVSSAAAQYNSNLVLSGDVGSSPNELLSVSDSLGFNRIVVAGSSGGGSFALDDVTYEADGQIIPEPSTFALLSLAIIGLLASRFSGVMRFR